MLKSKAIWKFSSNSKENQEDTSSLIENILQNKGIESVAERQKFLYPSLNDLTMPEQLEGMKKASERIMRAIEDGEHIMIYGDYDADGVTSTALLMNVFMDLGAHCDFYIPNRFNEGYGLNKQALERFQESGVSLVITVDNGIANIDEVAFANSIGLDMIVTDHHEVQEQVPDAYAVIHPKLSNAYPFKELAGVGVAFQLAHYLLEDMPTYLLELVAIGTIADLVPLKDENRILVYYGLKALNQSTNIGLLALKEACQLEPNAVLNEKDIGFKIAPRLNAVGRLQNASLAVDLLLTMDPDEARKIADQIEEINTERKSIVEKIVEEAEKRVEKEDGMIMLYDESWHEGVLGIAASRLVRTFDRPVILLTHKPKTATLKGSGRSIPAFHLFQNGMKIKDLFYQFGGHSQAAGMSFPLEQFDAIKQAFNEQIKEQLTPDDFKQELTHIQPIQWNNLTENFVDQLNLLAPFGMGNKEPTFHFKGIPSQMRQLGQKQQHLKLQFRENTHAFDVIGFQFGDLYYTISKDVEVAVVGKLQMNEWNGNKMVQMMLEDLAVDTWQLFDYRGKQLKKNMTPFFDGMSHAVLLGHSKEYLQQLKGAYENVEIITYNDMNMKQMETDILFICDLPPNLEILEQVITEVQPINIHVSYHVTDDAFLQTVPNRDEFKWLYGYLHQYQPIQLKIELVKIMKQKKWSKEKVIFMLKVFIDLKFIQVEDNIIYINENVSKTPLHKSITYQYRLAQGNIEKILYYSTYDELKQWLENYLKQDARTREEVTNES